MTSTAAHDRRQRHLLWFGAAYDSAFGVPLFLAPIVTTRLFGLIVPPTGDGTLWLRLDGIFLVIVSLFYLVTARDPSRYLGNVVVCLIGKIWSVGFYLNFVMAEGAPKTFLFFAVLDAIMFLLHLQAIGPNRWQRIREAFRAADLQPGPARLRRESASHSDLPNAGQSGLEPSLDPQVALHYMQFVRVTYQQYKHAVDASQPTPVVPLGWSIRWQIITAENGVIVPFGCAFVSDDQTELVLALRGTEDKFEWVEDGVLSDQVGWAVIPTQGRVHRGFHQCYHALTWSQDGRTSVGPLHHGFPMPIPQVQRFIVAGHSLGAAIALLTSLQAARFRWAPVSPQLYSYAGPRVGCPIFAAFVREQLPQRHLIVNTWDIVPHTPPENYFDPFKLHEYEYEHPVGKVVIDPGFSFSIHENHALDTYERGLQRLLKED